MSLTSQMAIQANADHNAPLLFVRFDYLYPNDPFLAVTAPFAITMSGTGDAYLDGETFQSLDGLSISDFQQDASGAIQEITLALALTDSSPILDLFDEESWWGSEARIWFGYFDPSDVTSIIFAPSLRISGFLDKLFITLDKDVAVASAVVRSNRMLFDRNRGNRYTSAQHEARYTGDLAFSFLPRLASGELLLANDKPSQVNRNMSGPDAASEFIKYTR